MPTYTYECSACDYQLEHIQSMTSKLLKKCPKCKKHKLIRLIGSGGATILKGGGWPGQDLKRSCEDTTLFDKARVARRLKRSGKVPTDAVLHQKDVDLGKYSGPKKLPKGHPERSGPSSK